MCFGFLEVCHVCERTKMLRCEIDPLLETQLCKVWVTLSIVSLRSSDASTARAICGGDFSGVDKRSFYTDGIYHRPPLSVRNRSALLHGTITAARAAVEAVLGFYVSAVLCYYPRLTLD